MKVLDSLGINEQTMGCAIHSSMEVVELGRLENGMPVYFDRHAAEADAVMLVCRVKAHTNFRAPIESGIVKMLVIGMGKIRGASAAHWYGFESFGELLPQAAETVAVAPVTATKGGVVSSAPEAPQASLMRAAT